jgi:Galactose oxidase-like, Early set domain
MAPASLTHHSDMHARYVELEPGISPEPPPPNTVYVKAPASSKFAPKGYYMLFLVTNPQGGFPKGTPSVATWVQLK